VPLPGLDGFALDDAAPMFELTLSDLASMVGLKYPLSSH